MHLLIQPHVRLCDWYSLKAVACFNHATSHEAEPIVNILQCVFELECWVKGNTFFLFFSWSCIMISKFFQMRTFNWLYLIHQFIQESSLFQVFQNLLGKCLFGDGKEYVIVNLALIVVTDINLSFDMCSYSTRKHIFY